MKDLPLFWDVAKNNANIYPLLAHIPIEPLLDNPTLEYQKKYIDPKFKKVKQEDFAV